MLSEVSPVDHVSPEEQPSAVKVTLDPPQTDSAEAVMVGCSPNPMIISLLAEPAQAPEPHVTE